jgi:broad specificity phosphatase PhoE
MLKLILIRHAECHKNIKGIHGGAIGEELTSKGISQSKAIAIEINKRNDISNIYYTPVVQAKQTAEYISLTTGIPAFHCNLIKPLNLGVISGISVLDASLRFPRFTESMDGWRRGELELCDLKIPGMEDPETFFLRGLSFVEILLRDHTNSSVCVVATRSVLILLENIALQHGIKSGQGYKEISYLNCSMKELGLDKERSLRWIKSQMSGL